MTSNQNAALDKEELEGSTEADTESVKEKTRKLRGKNYEIGNNSEPLLETSRKNVVEQKKVRSLEH